jgi:hypothetical protein
MAREVENCGYVEVMLSYMYDEIAAGDRERFENHLAECVGCTDEFAAIADARFFVYEWQKLEFAEMPTPQIVIPVGAAAREARVGIFDSVAAWAASWRWAFVGSLIVLLGLAVVSVNYFRRQELQTASGVDKPTASLPAMAAVKKYLPEDTPEVIAKEPAKQMPVLASQRVTTRRSVNNAPVKVVHTTRKPSAIGNSTFAVNNIQTINKSKAPVLSVDEYADENSLHLADLFEAEVGGNR